VTVAETIKLPVHALQSGDVTTGSGETIVSVSAGVRTPRGKMDVVLEKAGRRRTSVWGRHTAINVMRET
jgi:hypothetical protein